MVVVPTTRAVPYRKLRRFLLHEGQDVGPIPKVCNNFKVEDNSSHPKTEQKKTTPE